VAVFISSSSSSVRSIPWLYSIHLPRFLLLLTRPCFLCHHLFMGNKIIYDTFLRKTVYSHVLGHLSIYEACIESLVLLWKCIPRVASADGCWSGVAVAHWSRATKLTYVGPVSTGMGDCVRFNLRCGTFISVCNHPLMSTQPSHPFVGRGNE